MRFEIHVFAWLPYTRIDNLFWQLPDRERFGVAAAGPYFEGDQHVIPPRWPDDFRLRTCRAWQAIELPIKRWGDDVPIQTGGIVVNPMHVLGDDGRTRIHTEAGLVTRSVARIAFRAGNDCYEVSVEGAATIPFLLEAADAWSDFERGTPAHPKGQNQPSEVIPQAAWDLQLFIQQGTPATALRRPSGFDESQRFFGSVRSLGGEGGNSVYGTCTVCFFPSYAVYVSLRRGGKLHSAPVLFINGFGRNTSRVAVREACALRTVNW
jgi:hypothetical protein